MSTKRHVDDFIKTLEKTTPIGTRTTDVFADFCRCAALSLETPFARDGERKEIEEEYASITCRYGNDSSHFADLLATVVAALDETREEFLGTVLEELGMSNKNNGQFFTPVDVAKLMAEITVDEKAKDYVPGKVITLNDPACGASVCLIEGAEALCKRGVPQCDVFIDAGDIDRRACDISYIELSLLGYAAVVRHENGLTMKELSRPRFTAGYFLHSFPMRGWVNGRRSHPYGCVD